MERIQPMNELQIQEKVEDLAGKSAKILDCEQNTLSQTEEVLLVNGIPISLVGEEGAKIKQALIHGEVPHCDLVNNMLIRAGIEKNPVELETTVNVKSSVKTLEHYQLKDSKGVLMDEKMKEKEDEDEFRTVNVEIWSLEDSMLEPEGAGNPNSVRTTIKTNSNKKEPPTTTETAGNNNKKSKFSPLSSIIKPHKSDKTQKQSKKSQQQQSQQPTNNPTENTVPSSTTTTTTTTTTTVPKNKFLSLFSKGKSSKDNKKSNNSKLPTDQQHSTKVKDSNKTNSTTTTPSSTTEPSKANKRHNNSKNNKSSTNSSNNQDNDSLNKSAAADSKFETKKQQFNVNYLDPSKSLVHVEIDGIPVRVAYETFV